MRSLAKRLDAHRAKQTKAVRQTPDAKNSSNDALTRLGVIPPGSTIGILGGGQLGRMTALAAARLGYRCHIFCPETDSPAAQVATASTVAAYEDESGAGPLRLAVDVVTFEFENIPAGDRAHGRGAQAGAARRARAGNRPGPHRREALLRARGHHYRALAAGARLSGAGRARWPRSAGRPCSRPCAWATTARARRGFRATPISPRPGARSAAGPASWKGWSISSARFR